MSSPRPPPWPVPPHSPPASPTPSRLPKPKGNRLTKSPEPSGKRGKSPARAKGAEDRRTSLQVNTPQAPVNVHGGSNRRLSLGTRPPSTTGRQPTTPTINVSFASSGSNLNSLSASASASSTSFNQSQSQSMSGSGNDSPSSTSTHLPLSSRNTSPHASWIPGAAYMPGANSTTLAAIASTESPSNSPYFPAPSASASTSDPNLIPPQGLFGPLLVRENVLRARERERAASMGGMANSMITPTCPSGVGFAAASSYFGQSQSPTMSASAEQIHGLLEASGLVVPQQENGNGNRVGRGRFNSVASAASAATGSSSWSNSISGNTTLSAGAAAGVTSLSNLIVGAGGRNTPSNASSGHILPAGGIGEEEGEGESEDWIRREGMLDGISSMTHDTYLSHGEGASSTANLPRDSSVALDIDLNASATPAPLAPPVKLSKSSSLRSTLPSIRSFRNPFSFSRSASTSGAPSGEKAKGREKSKERSKSKERPSILPMANKNNSGSNVDLPVPSSPTNRFTYTPSSQRNQPVSPASPTLASTMQTQTLPRASVDTILPNSHLHGSTIASPGSGGNRFGFSGRAGRHSMDSPVGYTYGRLGTMFAGSGSATPPPAPSSTASNGGRIPVQAAYANGSRERIAAEQLQPQFQQTHGYSASLGSGGVGRVSPGLMGRSSPAFSGGVTGLVRPPVLDSHIELDERSLRTESGYGFGSERTESGYGFGGIQVSGDGVMLSPVDDLDEPYSFANHMEQGNDREVEEEEEREVHALLGEGVFQGEYESTEGHTAAAWAASAGVSPALTPYESRPISTANTFGSPTDPPPPSSYPYPTTYPEQEQSPDTSGEISNTTLTEPRLPPGLEHLIQQVEAQAQNEMEKEPSRDSMVERDLLGELARQLQRVMEQQSTTTLASRPPLSPSQPQTPSSILMFETGDSSQGHGRPGEDTERADEFGRWNVSDLKGAVERMKALIDEQERRTRKPNGRGHTKATNSISLNDTPPSMPGASLPSENSAQYFPSFGENGQTTPRRRLSNAILTTQDIRGDAKRKESQSSSSATATSTTVVTPITPHDGPSFPLPTFKNGVHERVESFDFASLDPDLVAMLSPNHMDAGQVLAADQDRRENDLAETREQGFSSATPALLPPISSASSMLRPRPSEVNEYASDMSFRSQEPPQSVAMGEDLTIATIASDGFGSMRSDKSVEEILLQRNFDYDQTGVEDESREEHSNRTMLDALALEPVATSSPPRKKLLHTPRASSVSTLPPSNSSKRERQEKASSSSTHLLLPVSETSQSQFAFPGQVSPSKSSPSRSPLSKLKGKDRPPLPQFEAEQQEPDTDTTEMNSARKLYPNGNQSSVAHISPSPSPTPAPRVLQGSGYMLTQLGHGRRPPPRTGGTNEISGIDRMRRAVTSGPDGYRSLNHEESRHLRLHNIPGSQSDTPPSRIGLDLSLGPRTARAFAAAGVLDNGPGSAPINRVATWRSTSVMGYRRDGIERDFGNASGTRSLASSPIPVAGMPGPSGVAARRITTLHERELLHGGEAIRTRAASDAWNRSGFNRTPDSSLRTLNMGGAGTDPSATSSPTSTGPPRTTLSSSTSSNLPPFELKGYRSSPAAPDGAAANAQQIHQAAIQILKERHELEKEALLSALSEAKKEARLEKAAKEELSLEVTEMGVYVEELETKLGEALARMRWMEKEIGILKDAVGVARQGSPMRDPQSSLRQSVENKRFKRISSPAPDTYNDDNIFDPRPNSRPGESPARTRILIKHVPASPPPDAEHPRSFPLYDENQSPLQSRHRRISSDASSIAVPRVDQSMSMLLQENGYADGYDESGLYSANEGSAPPSPTIVIGKFTPRSGEATYSASASEGNLLPTGTNHRVFGLQTPSRSRRNQPPSTIMEMSPTTTTADYSFNPGSPGSLVLRPEDEHHLGDLLSLMGSDDGM